VLRAKLWQCKQATQNLNTYSMDKAEQQYKIEIIWRIRDRIEIATWGQKKPK